jgi:ornithine cyclodeaminase/alanine dehydrogenase-like protein (mu-crystallin family)
MLILSEADIAALIDRNETIDFAGKAYRRHVAGEGEAARAEFRRDNPKAGCLIIAGADAGGSLLSVKSNVHAYPDGPQAPRRWGSLLTLWDLATARPAALISAEAFNEHRTAAGFAVAAKAFAPNAEALTVFGAGKSAPETIRYLRTALPGLKRIIVAGRSLARLEALAAAMRTAGIAIETGLSPAEAAAAADIVVTVTTASEPVFPGAALRPGTLAILGGANRPEAREVDDVLMARARVLLDSRDNAFAKAGDIIRARASGALVDAAILGEIGAFLDAPLPGAAGRDVTVVKSTGLALQDLLLAAHLVEKARAGGFGNRVDLFAGGGS